jgi:hypothetical protein
MGGGSAAYGAPFAAIWQPDTPTAFLITKLVNCNHTFANCDQHQTDHTTSTGFGCVGSSYPLVSLPHGTWCMVRRI